MTTVSIAPIHGFEAHYNPVNHVTFGREGSLMASADTAMSVKVWRNREFIREYDLRSISDKVRPTERIRGIRFSSNEERLFVAAGEYVAAFNLITGSEEPDWAYVAPRLFAFLIVSPTWIATSSRDDLAAAFDNGTIVIWAKGGERQALIRHNASPRMLT